MLKAEYSRFSDLGVVFHDLKKERRRGDGANLSLDSDSARQNA